MRIRQRPLPPTYTSMAFLSHSSQIRPLQPHISQIGTINTSPTLQSSSQASRVAHPSPTLAGSKRRPTPLCSVEGPSTKTDPSMPIGTTQVAIVRWLLPTTSRVHLLARVRRINTTPLIGTPANSSTRATPCNLSGVQGRGPLPMGSLRATMVDREATRKVAVISIQIREARGRTTTLVVSHLKLHPTPRALGTVGPNTTHATS